MIPKKESYYLKSINVENQSSILSFEINQVSLKNKKSSEDLLAEKYSYLHVVPISVLQKIRAKKFP